MRAGDNYETQGLAAVAAMKQIYEPSITNNVEYGGLIYKKFNGNFTYTEPVKGDEFNTIIRMPLSLILNKVVATYHSHGGDRGAYSDEELNFNDKQQAHEHKLDSYLVTPKGKMMVYPYKMDDYGPSLPVYDSDGQSVITVQKKVPDTALKINWNDSKDVLHQSKV